MVDHSAAKGVSVCIVYQLLLNRVAQNYQDIIFRDVSEIGKCCVFIKHHCLF